MRMLFSGVMAAGLLTSQLASAACVPAAEREALDVAGLKTQLMVQTLTCKNDDQYNAFINKFKPELVTDDRIAHTYFSHVYGRSGQTRQDEYMTQLANAKADASQKDGSRFCSHNQEIFSEVLALQNGAELKEYAAGRAVANPTAFTTCEANERTTRTTEPHHTTPRRRKS